MKNTIWDIKEGEAYYRLNASGLINLMIWKNDEYDVPCRECFNAFLTKEEAEAELNARKKKAQALKPILDEAERRYLKAVIRPFRDKVDFIAKYKRYSENKECIVVAICLEGMFFPDFKTGTMYQGMETDKQYTLEELGL